MIASRSEQLKLFTSSSAVVVTTIAAMAGCEVADFFAYDGDHGMFDGVGGLLFAEEVEHHLAGADRGQWVDDVFAGVLRRAAADRFEHAGALRIDVAAGCDAHAALHHGA